ncbi:MAG: S41 family peptidase [Bacteroidaceae bacterium]
MSKNRSSRFIPLIVALSAVIGILLGSFYANHFSGNRLSIINTSSNKLNDLLHIIDDQYVDKVSMDDLVEKALPQILKELDPHSTYVCAKDVENDMQGLKGSFSGIGIQFNIYKDTICISNVIKDGPSEEVGLAAGDRIVVINGKPFVGKKVTSELAMATLKGEKGSSIKLGIKRVGSKNILNYTIIRGDIPVKSIESVYMVDKTTGYIRIKSFGDTTYPEMLIALAKLNHEGFKNLIIDLRENYGGYMAPAIQMANEFLPKDRLILYTKGRKSPREEYRSDGRGTYQKIPLIVLVNQTSASASEIFAGAIQDNDRGTIVGLRTFGKGLVQEPIQFRDGSMLRLTIARYYTPSGRCLQKPYINGDDKTYNMDLLTRAEQGEYYSPDSIRHHGERFKTSIGRIVYGGGGIIPDYFVPSDSSNITSYYQEAVYKGFISIYAFTYVDENREALKKMGTWQEIEKQLKKANIPEKFASFADKNGLKRRNLMLKKSHKLFEEQLIANIIYNFIDIDANIQYINTFDPFIIKAKNIFKEQKAFPQKSMEPKSKKKNER